MGEVGLLAQLAPLAFCLGDVGAQLGQFAFQFGETLTPLFLLGLVNFDVAHQSVMAFLVLPDFGLKMAALLTHHGFGGRAGAVRSFMTHAFKAQLFQARLFTLDAFTQVTEA